MTRSTMILLLGSLLATPAIAQQPIPPSEYGQPPAQPQYPPPQVPSQQPQQYGEQPPQQYGEQPIDPNAVDPDDDDDAGYDITYDVTTEQDQYDDGYDPNAYQQFQSQLSPYGSWEEMPNYGQVWVPSTAAVGADFSPYSTGGHFIMSDYGWTWASDYDWGWAPFHYGRWMVMGGRGWCWIPGTTWAPAWVNWRWGGGYVGWAPMAPRGVVIGPPRGVRGAWRFTVAAQLGQRRVSYLPARVVPSVWTRTSVVSNVRSVNVGGTVVHAPAGPPPHLVAAAVGHPITPVALNVAAPHALPRANITPHVGAPLQTRPWMQPHPVGGGVRSPAAPGGVRPSPARTIGATMPARPVYSQPYRAPAPTYAQQPYRPAAQPYRAPATYTQPYRAPVYNNYHPTYTQPVYHAPVYNNYHPTYSQPTYTAPTFHSTPSYSAPVYHSAPTYSAPTYSAPSYHSAPSGGGFHGGGGGGGHHR